MFEHLTGSVEATIKVNKKLHEVWELSFEWKDCAGNEFVWQKFDYIHNNPCKGKWQLQLMQLNTFIALQNFI